MSARGKGGAGRLVWRGVWRLIGSLAGAFADAKREYRTGKRGPARPTKRSTKGRRTGGRGGGFTPVDGRSVEDIRQARKTTAEGWDVTYTRPKWAGGTQDPFDPDQWGSGRRAGRRGSGVPWSTTHGQEDDPWMTEMQVKHGVDRWGQPIEGHDRWTAPEGQAELEAALAAEQDAEHGGLSSGAETGQDSGNGTAGGAA